MEKLAYLLDEQRYLTEKEQFLLKAISSISEKCNALQIERLHLQSQKAEIEKLKTRNKCKESNPGNTAKEVETVPQPAPTQTHDLDVNNEEVNQREIDLSITNSLTNILSNAVFETESDEEPFEAESEILGI